MTAIRRSRLRWVLIPVLAILAALAALALLRDESPADQGARLPFDFRETAGTSTDSLVGSLQRKIRENPKDFEAHIHLANAYLQKVRETGDPTLYTKTEDLLDEAKKLEPQSPELFATRGTLALARHDFAAALGYGAQALASDPESARYHGIVGDAQIELGMYDEAIDSYQEMVNSRPDFAAYSRVAYARELYGDPEGAIEAMEFALRAGSGTPENVAWAHVQLGNLWFGSGNLKEAEKAYGRSTETVSAYAPALAGEAKVAAARGNLELASKLYQKAFNRMPLPEYAIALGDVYAEMGEEDKAEAQYELVRNLDKLLRANGVNTDLEIALFYADHDMDLQTSLDKARAAYDARPSIHAADALAWTLYKTGNYEEAQKYSSEALKLETRDPLKLFHAGMISKELGQKERAREYLQQAIDLNPHFSLLYADEAADSLKSLKSGGAN
ncbi:MAG: tetratricopeptide repeat protein [Rubrobacteraceae bacterium]|nr:tetratricopeptide repeat protein [Rubrobacteraceae bacterium]